MSFSHSVTGDRHTALYTEFKIVFTHMPTGRTTNFTAILNKFNDEFSSTWEPSEHWGRMDPVAQFKNTQRTIDVINDDAYESAANMENYQLLTRFLYPKYDSPLEKESLDGGAVTISSAPLIGIKFGNLLKDHATSGPLVGYVDGFSFKPDDELGYWYSLGMDNTSLVPMDIDKKNEKEYKEAKAAGLIDMDDNVAYEAMPPKLGDFRAVDGPVLLPRKFTIDCTFHVLHTHPVGWTSWNDWTVAAGDYPYGGENLSDSMPPHMAETVIIEEGFSYKQAKVPLSVEKSLLGAILGF